MTSPLPLRLHAAREHWPFANPFSIAGHTWDCANVVVVTLEGEGRRGRGEAAGVFYRNESVETMLAQIEQARPLVEQGLTRQALQSVLPAGGARNALDCAYWDLEAALTETPVWQRAGLKTLEARVTTFTCGVDAPEAMAEAALAYQDARAIKLKLAGDPLDVARVQAVRRALPEAWLGIDANQSYDLTLLKAHLPAFVDADIRLIEQPLRVGAELELRCLDSPIPVAADESVHTVGDIALARGLFDVINIKLDKAGGLSHALEMTAAARAAGLGVMVGNMPGTSLSMAPAFVLAQICDIADLDGAVFLARDRAPSATYRDGLIDFPSELWGGGEAASHEGGATARLS